MQETTNMWGPSIWAVALGLAWGVLLVGLLWRRGMAGSSTAAAQAQEARSELGAIVAALRELEERAAALDAGFYASERASLEARAATLMRRIEQQAFVAPAAAAPRVRAKAEVDPKRLSPLVRFFVLRPRLQGALWGMGIVLIAGFLGLTVQQSSKPRADDGGVGASGQGPMVGALEVSPEELETLRKRLNEDGNDVAALLRVAHLALRAQQFAEAQTFNDRALSVSPNALEGLVHQAVLAAKDGDGAAAEAGLQAALKRDPGFVEAWFFRGMLSMQAGDMPRMQESFAQYLKLAEDGPQKERIRAMVARTKTD